MRPLVRMLKHVLLAAVLIVGSACMLEVGLRTHRLHAVFTGRAETVEEPLIRPCPLTYQHLPLGYVGSHPSEETGTRVEVRTNSLGLRGGEVMVPKPVGRYRIVCLGDEATLALDIEADQTFCSRLQEVLQPNFEFPVEVINAGQPGHCPLLSLAWARLRLVGLQPDLVILFCDISDVGDDRRCRPLAKFDNHGTLLSVSHPATNDRAGDLLSALEGEFLLARMFGEYLGDRITDRFVPLETDRNEQETTQDSVGPESALPSTIVAQTWEPLADLQEFCRQISTEFFVAVVPSAETVRSVESREASEFQDRVSEILQLLADRASRERIPMLDASPEFARHQNRSRLFLSSSGALTTEGHRLFSEILGQALSERAPQQSRPQTIPVSGELTAIPTAPVTSATSTVPEDTFPLRTLERRPRAPAATLGVSNEAPHLHHHDGH